MSDNSTYSDSEPRLSRRRDLIKKALALAPAVYAAPAILGSTTTVSAASGGGGVCTAGTCGTYVFGCTGNQSCACVQLINGSSYCTVDWTCFQNGTCSLQSPCPQGFVCVVGSCCGTNECVPTTTQCVGGAAGTSGVSGSGKTGLGH